MATSTQIDKRQQNVDRSGKEARGDVNEMAKRKGIDKPNFTQTPNILFDELMRDMGEAELKVTLAIIRQTFGWHRQFYEMSLTDLQEFTGLSRPSVTKGIDAGIRRGTMRRRHDDAGTFYYGLVVNDADDDEGRDYPLSKKPKSPSKKSLPVEPITSKNSLLVASKNSLPIETVTGKNSLPEVVKNLYQESQELDEKIPLLKKGKKITTKEREKERSSSSSDHVLPAPKDDDDDLAFEGVVTAWDEGMPEKATKTIRRKLRELVDECGPDTVIHAIGATVEAGGRSFKYVATCARNGSGPKDSGGEAARRSEYAEYNHLLSPVEQKAQS